MDRMTYTQGYRELRALVEELLSATVDSHRAQLLVAIRIDLQLHCRECGQLLDRQLRAEQQAFCYACVASGPATEQQRS